MAPLNALQCLHAVQHPCLRSLTALICCAPWSYCTGPLPVLIGVHTAPHWALLLVGLHAQIPPGAPNIFFADDKYPVGFKFESTTGRFR